MVGFFRSNPWDSKETPVPRAVLPKARSPCPSWCWTRSPRQESVVPVFGSWGGQEWWWKTAIRGRREGKNFSTVKRWRQDSLNDQTKQCQKLWPKPFKNTINLHHVCSRGCTLYTPRFFIMTPPIYQLLLPQPRLLLSSSLLSSLRRLAFARGVIDPFFGP